jgi:LysR family glycine cleavage system transcriptional activator
MARKLPSLNALRAFEAAARHGSFTAAAKELHVTHAAISRHELETWLKISLFRRLHRGVALTEPGDRYRRTLTSAFDRMAEVTAEITRDQAAGRLTVSVEPAFAARWLVPRLGSFRRACSEIDVELDPSNRVVDFRAEPADLAIRYGEGPWPGVRTIHLVEVICFPVCSPKLVEQVGGLAHPADLQRVTLLHEETREWWHLWFEEAGAPGIETGRGPMLADTNLTLEAAAAGQGVALGDNVLAADDIAKGRLVKLFDIESASDAYHLVAPTANFDLPAVQAFRDWIVAEMANFLAPRQ